MPSANKPVIQIQGNVRFRAATGANGKQLGVESIAALAEYLNSKGIVAQLEELAAFCDTRNISIPVMSVRSGNTEITIQSVSIDNQKISPAPMVPWYKRPIKSFFI